MFLGSLSHHNKDLEQRTLEPSALHRSQSWTNRVIALRQISVTALFYIEDSRRIHPRSVRACQPKDSKRRDWRSASGREKERKSTHTHMRERKWEREKALWLLLLYVFSSTWACPMQIGFSQECCLFRRRQWHPTPGPWNLLDLPCLLATAILDSFSLFYLPNNIILTYLCIISII